MNLWGEQLITAVVLGGALAAVALMAYIEKRSRAEFRTVLIPTTPILLASGLVALLALVHLLNLAGIHTGR
jgi:hypothetical protein